MMRQCGQHSRGFFSSVTVEFRPMAPVWATSAGTAIAPLGRCCVRTVTFAYDPAQVSLDTLEAVLDDAGYTVAK